MLPQLLWCTINNLSLNSHFLTASAFKYALNWVHLLSWRSFSSTSKISRVILSSPVPLYTVFTLLLLASKNGEFPFKFFFETACDVDIFEYFSWLMRGRQWQAGVLITVSLKSINSEFKRITFMWTHLSMLMAQRLRMLAVHSKTSNDIQNSHNTQPRGHDPDKTWNGTWDFWETRTIKKRVF